MTKQIVGGGPKKVLYTLKTLQRIGLINSTKALRSHNTCKACGLGMGGQRGGMTNELGEFPAVCNKSVQAQSTDVQAPIPAALFEQHSIADFRGLSAHELEHLGRLANPLYKPAGGDHFIAIEWQEALAKAGQAFAATQPQRSFFYSSGRSSNEAGFLLQLLARLYGSNNVNNCSFYCHQASGVGMNTTVGTGTATIALDDLAKTDLVFVIGANPASNHPRFIHQLKAVRDRGGEVIVINPAREPGLLRFAVPKSFRSMIAGGTEIASDYLQPHIGGDLALLKGLAKAVKEKGGVDLGFIESFCEGYADFAHDIEAASWQEIEATSGLCRKDIERVAEIYCRAEKVVFAWGMGITHHSNGVDNVEYIANLALLRGMIGKPGAGLLPLRGHSNVQGIGSIGVKPVLPATVLEKLEQHFSIELPRGTGMDTLACLEAADNGNIDAALLMGGNLYAATPDSHFAASALDRIKTKIYLTTTLNSGHLHGVDQGEVFILPVTARDEELQPTTQESMFNYVRLSEGGILRLQNVRPEVEILASLGEQLLPNSDFNFNALRQHGNLREAIAATVPGMEALADIDSTRQEFHIAGRLMHTPHFHTDSGKAHFVVRPLAQISSQAEFPLRLATVRSEGQFNTMIYEEQDSYRGTEERWSVMMNSSDMQTLGIAAGDFVDLISAVGKMQKLKAYAFDVPPGNLLAYFPEANVLCGKQRDPRSQTPAFKSIAVAAVKHVANESAQTK